MTKILLITPPFVQPNSPYPATAYLKGYLTRNGIAAEQYDLSVELLNAIFSPSFLSQMFDAAPQTDDANLLRIHALRRRYISTVESVIGFLSGDQQLSNLICTPEFIPQCGRFETMADIEQLYGTMGSVDCAKYISTLYLQDLSDYIRATVAPHFEIARYGEKIAVSIPSYKDIAAELAEPLNAIEELMLSLLEATLDELQPEFVGFSVPFPGNLLCAMRCAEYIKKSRPTVKTIMGGGYPTTELRQMSDKGIYSLFDYVVLDDGELALKRIVEGGVLIRTHTAEGFHDNYERVSHAERGCPDFSGLPHNKYFSTCEATNPMHRLWGDGRWNKIMLAHGCYWAKCAFCDTSLDYIGCYDAVSAVQIVDWMEQIAAQTGSRGFHFVDEAAPPKLLKEISLEIIRRNVRFAWWTNIRFENAYTGDLCSLMALAGCIAVSGGLEVASDRLLALINKGITIEQATIAMRNFYYSGIMVHTYLMYGLPTQTLQESVDALEVVRQMFRAELIGSGFWHRYAMTVHSPSGISPEIFGVRRKNDHVNCFANNEVHFVENRTYNVAMVGEALRISLANYMAGEGLEKAVHKWFEGKVQATTVEDTLIVDHLIKPDSSRIFDESARLIWIGGEASLTDEGVQFHNSSTEKELKFSDVDARFLVEITDLCSDLTRRVTLGEVRDIYAKHSSELFSALYHSKKWDVMRGYGLLQI